MAVIFGGALSAKYLYQSLTKIGYNEWMGRGIHFLIFAVCVAFSSVVSPWVMAGPGPLDHTSRFRRDETVLGRGRTSAPTYEQLAEPKSRIYSEAVYTRNILRRLQCSNLEDVVWTEGQKLFLRSNTKSNGTVGSIIENNADSILPEPHGRRYSSIVKNLVEISEFFNKKIAQRFRLSPSQKEKFIAALRAGRLSGPGAGQARIIRNQIDELVRNLNALAELDGIRCDKSRKTATPRKMASTPVKSKSSKTESRNLASPNDSHEKSPSHESKASPTTLKTTERSTSPAPKPKPVADDESLVSPLKHFEDKDAAHSDAAKAKVAEPTPPEAQASPAVADAEATPVKPEAHAAADDSVIESDGAYTHVFQDIGRVKMITKGPDLVCPEQIRPENFCFANQGYADRRIVLDAGHDESSSASRSGNGNLVHEGDSNQVVALMVRDLLIKCLKVSQSQIKLTRYPGEHGRFGEYMDAKARPKISAEISSEDKNARINYINELLGISSRSAGSKQNNGGLFISIHADTADHERGGTDHVSSFIRWFADKKTQEVAQNITDAVVANTAEFYTSADPASKYRRGRSNADIQRELLTHSEVNHRNLAMNSSRIGTQDTVKLLVEGYFMDGAEKQKMNEQISQSLAGKAPAYDVWTSTAGQKAQYVRRLAVTDMQMGIARGLLQGIANSYRCD